MDNKQNQVTVNGAMLLSFAQACVNLKIIAGEEAARLTQGVELQNFYPLEHYTKLTEIVQSKYKDAGPIQESVGIEMMNLWYNFGPGKGIVSTGAAFLKFQTGSEGYHSMVKGPGDLVGDFQLKELDSSSGKAEVISSTPLNRDIERGVLLGGIRAPGDCSYVSVRNDQDPNRFVIEFH